MVKFFPQSFPKGKKMGQNPKILPQILVPLAGLEPARSLDRGILRLGGAKIAVFWVSQQSAKRGKNARKTPKNAPKSTFCATVQNLLKITKNVNFPILPKEKLTKKRNSCIFSLKIICKGCVF